MTVTSNYVNSLQGKYQYSYTKMQAYKGYNTAEINYGAGTQSNYINASGAGYLGNIQSAAKSMQEALQNVSKTSTYNKNQAVSSSTEHLTISSASDPAESWTSSNVSILQLATSQVNRSDDMKATEAYKGGLGYQQFEIEIGGKTHQIGIEVKGGDTNKTVQEKMAKAINAKDIGVIASVSSSSAAGTSALVLSSKGTGDTAANNFSIRDVQGKLVDTMSATTITQDAQDARYIVDAGYERTSHTNEVDLGNGVKATLHKVTEDSVDVTKGKDTAYIKSQITDMVKGFNALYDIGKDYASTNPKLANDLTKAYNAYYKDMEKVGITMSDKGLSINEKQLDAAIEDGSLEKLMTDYGRGTTLYGFTGRLSAVATGARHNTQAYVGGTEQTTGTSGTSTTQNYNWLDNMDSTSTINKSNFDVRVYSNYMSLGYFMDMFV